MQNKFCIIEKIEKIPNVPSSDIELEQHCDRSFLQQAGHRPHRSLREQGLPQKHRGPRLSPGQPRDQSTKLKKKNF